MKLPTRVRAHELHPDSVKEFRFGGTPVLWAVANATANPPLPFLPNTDHWYVDAAGPPVFAAAQAAGELEVIELASAAAYASVAGLIHQTYQPLSFVSPAQVPAGDFNQTSGSSLPDEPTFVLIAQGTLNVNHIFDRLAIMVLPGTQTADFKLSWIVAQKPDCQYVSFGSDINAKFKRRAPSEAEHPAQWGDVWVYEIP
ncbi:MAG: hypothetical protein AAF447_17885 [Myxococcota bacterium]